MITNLPNIIFLCGFMGAGKSTIGEKLAHTLEVSYRDIDDIIEEKAAKPIRAIFEDSGEAEFRKIERRTLLQVIRDYVGILSLGGGSLQNQHIVDHVKHNGLLIFIDTPFSVILDRIIADQDRPLLLDESGEPKDRSVLENELKKLYRKRLPFYKQAKIIISNPGTHSPEQLVKKLIKKIRNHVAHH
jgi:shikimate kinase